MQRKGALPGKIFARCILQRRFAGLFGCMARISCQNQLISDAWPEATFGMHGAQNLPRMAARERTAAESCHGKALENASRENIATASQAKGASGRNPATVGRWETHFASILPSSSARERTVAEYCHYQSPESAFVKILPWTNDWIRPAPNNCRPPRIKTAAKAGLGERPRQKHERQSAGAAGASSGYGAVHRAIAEHSGMQRGEISPWPITRPETKEGEHFARLLLFTARVAIGAFAVGSRRHLAVSLIEAHIR